MKQLRVGMGTTVLHRGMASSGIDGIGHYTKELVGYFAADTEVQLIPFTFGTRGAIDSGLTPYRLPSFGASALPSLLLGRSFGGCEKLSKRVDLIHATDHLIPKCRSAPVVATIHDAIPLAHPEWVNYRFSALKNHLWRKTAGFADHIITVSEHSKRDLVRFFGLHEDRITVTPLGVNERWFVKPDARLLDSIRERYQLPEKFFLFVGTLQPRKNVAKIIDAHRRLPISTREAFPLIIVGREGWQCQDVIDRLRMNDAWVRWLRYVPDDDLLGIFRSAFALVFPSLHEGFGLPVLEAFASELPVITSNTTSLPEVAGDAAILIDPHDMDSISDAMLLLTEDSAVAQQLRNKGLVRAKSFTWEKTALATLVIYRQLGLRDI
jgi:alpha-1,3-rhamnosyl/mannosyltransferase